MHSTVSRRPVKVHTGARARGVQYLPLMKFSVTRIIDDLSQSHGPLPGRVFFVDYWTQAYQQRKTISTASGEPSSRAQTRYDSPGRYYQIETPHKATPACRPRSVRCPLVYGWRYARCERPNPECMLAFDHYGGAS